MNKKQIILNYEEYLEMEQKIKELIDILSRINFRENISDETKKCIENINKLYGFWI